jgi:hypothetical protein
MFSMEALRIHGDRLCANIAYLAGHGALWPQDRWRTAARSTAHGRTLRCDASRHRSLRELLLVSSDSAPGRGRAIPRLAFIDSDPVFTQTKLARGRQDFRAVVDAHDVHFSWRTVLIGALNGTPLAANASVSF